MSLHHGLRAAAGRQARVVSLEYTHTAESVTNATSYTFNTVNIGTATADRLVVVVAMGSAGASGRTISGITIDGTAGSSVVTQGNSSASNDPICFIAQRVVTSGTSISVVVACGGNTFNRMAIAVYTLKDYQSSTAVDTDQTLYSSSTNTATATLDLSSGGVAIYGAQTNGNRTSSWSSASENVDAQYSGETSTYTAANKTNTSTTTADVETVTWSSGGPQTSAIVAASWR